MRLLLSLEKESLSNKSSSQYIRHWNSCRYKSKVINNNYITAETIT